jgi:hypothetical protein
VGSELSTQLLSSHHDLTGTESPESRAQASTWPGRVSSRGALTMASVAGREQGMGNAKPSQLLKQGGESG